MRRECDYPDYSGYIDYLDAHGFDDEVMNRIIDRHTLNREYTKKLYERYKCYEDAVPIFSRRPRFDDNIADSEGNKIEPLNNKINNDFFGEINDIMIGYFAGKAASYSYSSDDDAIEQTGGDEAVDEARNELSSFITRNNFYDLNQEVTKYASVCGYAGRLFYIDREGKERCMVVPPYEAIALTRDKVQEPNYAVRYYSYADIDGAEHWKAEGYDQTYVYYYEGQLGSLHLVRKEAHLFGCCPMQIIPLNGEMMSSAERVLSLIDAYDKDVSDNANDAEGNTQAQEVFDGIELDGPELAKAKRSGSIQIPPAYNGASHSVYFLTKDINDGFNEHHLDRLERNIYRFSKTPNLNDETFNAASGISLKFKLTAFEAKCGTFEAKMNSADTYMFKVIGSSFEKRAIPFDYLQVYVEYKRNFPVDVASEAQAVQALINAGVPEEIAYNQLSCVDDIDYLMALKEQSKADAIKMFEPDDDTTGDQNDDGTAEQDPMNDGK